MKNILFQTFQKMKIILQNNVNLQASQVKINKRNIAMTSKQIKYGLGNTLSGNLNKKQAEGKFKQIQLEHMDVQMISPQFLQSKTLKKPLKEYGINFSKTSENFLKAQNDKTQTNGIGANFTFQPLKSMEEFNMNLNKTQKMDYTFISLSETGKIKPAYSKNEEDLTLRNNKPLNSQFSIDDKNTIFSAISKKGSKPKKSITFEDTKEVTTLMRQSLTQKRMGKAQNKLKQLFNKNVTKPSSFATSQSIKAESKKVNKNYEINEQIQESINSYGDQGFQKYSQQSGAIKQSIRQQFIASGSGFIKQSIRESIGQSSGGKLNRSDIHEEIKQSIKQSESASKDQIPEFIGSYRSSSANIRQDIRQSLSASRKSGESVYEQIFQDYEDSLKNSRGAFKKSANFKDKQSDVLSKSFRKKTSVVKSIKLASQINLYSKAQLDESLRQQLGSNKYTQQLIQEKKNILKKKTDITELFRKKHEVYSISDKHKNLIYDFKIQINRLLTSQNFQTKLRRLTSFINFGENDMKKSIGSLEDSILKNIMEKIDKIKNPQRSADEIQRLRQEYDQKLNFMLKNQQISLKVQMEKKMHEKDMEVKKMIAQLQKRFENRTFTGINVQNSVPQKYNIGESGLYEIDSDYSIDSDNISWKADLWQTLPQYEKKKLYEKQTKEVTNFLTQIMMNELKEQSLNRDLDISFEFPMDLSLSNEKLSDLPSFNRPKTVQSVQELMMPKSAFNRKQFEENISASHPPKKQSVFPDFPKPKQKTVQSFLDLAKKQNVNQYSKLQGEPIVEHTKTLTLQRQNVLQILSKYKSSYIRKKNDIVRKILKVLRPKQTKKVPHQNIPSVVQEITILSKEDVDQKDILYIRAYEEELIWALANIITKNENKKNQIIEEEMRKHFDRLVILCQVKTAQSAEKVVCLNIYEDDKELSKTKNRIPLMTAAQCPLETGMRDEAIEMIEVKQEKNIKDQLVENILNILMGEFAKDFPSRKK